jgi:hypothetical protein
MGVMDKSASATVSATILFHPKGSKTNIKEEIIIMKIEGFDEFQKQLKELSQNAKELDGKHDVPVNELLTSEFISSHTHLSSADELFEKSGFKVESLEDFTNIPDDKWDQYIRSISSFSNWEAMLSKATELWATKKLSVC